MCKFTQTLIKSRGCGIYSEGYAYWVEPKFGMKYLNMIIRILKNKLGQNKM